ncbi:aminotransferase class I/II-fold pyridoxal phosphate-dependent enzyme [Spiribacter halobius]|uniref:Aminotransferase class I/classII large domain-containing protein n=1 Tax=Sediminicurvatus halobius TaxID=2182432 RepID=A0A2U2MXK0_9GAMM|nr:aminotransferase class I/II-fold pyridoxal phosphate-dependent enzyme [Spiribacter halobius]PWG61645.1 hypothetical protein DEM34_15330 [Spiribacter halobius]UEX79457.1 aminotransferase class I/II-fold pyridoxal phosphate-dependent enzyme [Spiribacter halobius]
MDTDSFGNPLAAGLPYARGRILRSTEDDLTKLRHAWTLIERRLAAGAGVFNFTGLERGFHAGADEVLDDELAPARHAQRLAVLACEHLGGDPGRHDVMLFNRQTAALMAAMLCLAERGDTIIGVSPTYSHPCIARGAGQVGARYLDVVGSEGLRRALREADGVSLVVLTRLAVSYEILPEEELREIVTLAHRHGARVLLDDAGGARVGPALFEQSRSLEYGVDVASTGLDKYGTVGPRLGLMVGERDLVARIRAFAFGFGLEARPMLYPAVVASLAQYRPARVRELVAATKGVATALRGRLGARVSETPIIALLRGEDILELALERAGLAATRVVPVEATAALAMTLLREHGVHTVHLAAIPPGTSALLIKFVPPETLERFGGPDALAAAIDESISRVATLLTDEAALRAAILGPDAE